MESVEGNITDAHEENALLEAFLMDELLDLQADIIGGFKNSKIDIDEATSALNAINDELRRRIKSASKYTIAIQHPLIAGFAIQQKTS